ncbi:MAG: TIR domain-containing protein [Anaerolineales bacterium]
MSDVFVSYSRSDIAFARLLHEALQEHNFDTWIDWQDIPPSVDWLEEVYQAIEEADTFLFIISKNSLDSEICSLEIAHAAKNNKRMIPVVIDNIKADQVPKPLRDLNWVFFKDEEEFSNAFQTLMDAIHTDYEWVKEHTRLQVRALEWDRKGKKDGYLLRGGDLAEAESWLASAPEKDPRPTALQNDYILSSRQAANRRQRITLGAVTLGLVISIALGVAAWRQRNQAVTESQARATAQAEAVSERATAQAASTQSVKQKNEAERQARLARAGFLSVESFSQREDQLDLALLLALEAITQADTMQSRSSLLSALVYRPQFARFFYGHQGPVSNADFSPDGTLLATAGCSQPGPSAGNITCTRGEILLWDLSKGTLSKRLKTPHPTFISDIAFSPSDDLLVSTDWLGNIAVWDAEEQTLLAELEPSPSGRILDVVFTSDGESFLTSHEVMEDYGTDGEIRIWDAKTMELMHIQRFPAAGSYANLEVTPDGKYLIAAKLNLSVIHLWDLENWERVQDTFSEYESQIYQIDLSPDGDILALGNQDGSLQLWDMEKDRPLGQPLEGHDDYITGLAFNPDGDVIISSSQDQSIRLWDVQNRELIGKPINFHQEKVPEIAFHPQGEQFVSVSADSLVGLWNLSSSTLIDRPFGEHSGPVWDVDLTSDAETAVSGGVDGTLRIWDIGSDPELRDVLQAQLGQIYCVAISPDDRLLAAGGQEGIHLWDLEKAKSIGATLQEHGDPVISLAFSPDGDLLASGGMDSQVMIWDVKSRKRVESLTDPHSIVPDVAFSPNGSTLTAVGCSKSNYKYCEQGEIHFWDLGSEGRIHRSYLAHAHDIWTAAFSPGGKVLATGSADKTVMFWDVENGQQIGEELGGFKSMVLSLRYSPDGSMLASGDQDGNVILWDLDKKQTFGPALTSHTADVNTLVFSEDGHKLVSASHDGRVLLWDLSLERWKQLACQRAGRNLTEHEWESYFPGKEYQTTCPEYPEKPSLKR